MGCKEKSISWLLFLMLGSYKKRRWQAASLRG